MADQPLAGDSRNLLAGTYIAEQRSREAYSLSAINAPKSVKSRFAGVAEASSPRRGARRVAGQYFEQIKCTVLPALSTIDPLLNPETNPEMGAELEERSKKDNLVSLQERKRKKKSEQAMWRLYPQHRSPTQLGERSLPVPTDEEFHAWLKPQGQGTTTPAAPQPGLTAHRRSFVIQPGDNAPRSWYLFLLRSTFADKMVTAEAVAEKLVHLLGLEHRLAKQCANYATKRVMTKLECFEDRSLAFQKQQELERAGLDIQVVSDVGLPDVVSVKPSPRQPGKETYAEIFQQSPLRESPPKVLPPLILTGDRSTQRRGGDRQWKCDLMQQGIEELPADPVEAFFESERLAREQKRRDEEQEVDPTTSASIAQNLFTSGKVMMRAKRWANTERADRDGPFGASQASPRSRIEPDSETGGAVAGAISNTASTVLEAVSAQQKVSAGRKEACQMMRIFVFGAVGNEALPAREKGDIYYEARGDKEQVLQLANLWRRLDTDGSGRVDFKEFQKFAEKNMREKLAALRVKCDDHDTDLPTFVQNEDCHKFCQKLCDRLKELLLAKKSSFGVEDVMRMIWPASSLIDLRDMKKMCTSVRQKEEKGKVSPPDVLGDEDYEGLCSVFQFFDADGTGVVPLDELVAKGYLYDDEAKEYLREYDQDNDGQLGLLEFCQLMCPVGYRAHKHSTIGTKADGTKVRLDKKLGHWIEVLEHET